MQTNSEDALIIQQVKCSNKFILDEQIQEIFKTKQSLFIDMVFELNQIRFKCLPCPILIIFILLILPGATLLAADTYLWYSKRINISSLMHIGSVLTTIGILSGIIGFVCSCYVNFRISSILSKYRRILMPEFFIRKQKVSVLCRKPSLYRWTGSIIIRPPNDDEKERFKGLTIEQKMEGIRSVNKLSYLTRMDIYF